MKNLIDQFGTTGLSTAGPLGRGRFAGVPVFPTARHSILASAGDEQRS